jgi:hypothetical protein
MTPQLRNHSMARHEHVGLRIKHVGAVSVEERQWQVFYVMLCYTKVANRFHVCILLLLLLTWEHTERWHLLTSRLK